MKEKIIDFLSTFRWIILLIAIIVLFISVYKNIIHPKINLYIIDSKEKKVTWEAVKHKEELPLRVKELDHKIVSLNETLKDSETKEDFTEAELLNNLYDFASRTGFTIVNIEIDDPTIKSNGSESSISLYGNGTYNSIGRFIASIEQMNRFVRISHATVQSTNSEKYSSALEFIVMEENRWDGL